MNEVVRAVASEDILGEAPVWCPREQALYWVDIEGCKLQRFHPASGRIDRWTTPERLCSFALREKGGLVAAFASGLAFYEPEAGTVEWIARPEASQPRNRMNDGKCDRSGRFFVGSMDDKLKEHLGALYRLDPDLSLHRLDGGIGISNSLAWSPDEKSFYFADTMSQEIYVYDYDRASGDIGNRRIFATTLNQPGTPDGSSIDAEGYLWNAQWDGWRLTRYAPDGRIDRIVELPVSRPSSCMFGGPDLRTLYVTTAIFDLSAAGRARQPWAGSLLAVDVGVAGLPEPRFGG
jgi:L-arabinonolactonase